MRRGALTTGEGSTPDVFGIKMTAIYLSEDVDAATMNNVGNVARIWTNPVCDAGHAFMRHLRQRRRLSGKGVL
jgi:hypothetical protein